VRRRFHERGSRDADLLGRALEAAGRNDPAAVRTALAELPELERFVAILGVGALFPHSIAPAAVAANELLPRETQVFEWPHVCAA
jgi:hypothetical protein